MSDDRTGATEMTMRKPCLEVLSVVILLFVIGGVAYADSVTSHTLMLNKIDDLRYSFGGMWDMSSGSMNSSIQLKAKDIQEILNYAGQSDDTFALCYSGIVGILKKHNEEFRPGVAVRQEVLQKLSGHMYRGEDPEAGFGVLAYLLIELARAKRSTDAIKDALGVLSQTYTSCGYVTLSYAAFKNPQDTLAREELAKMNRGEPARAISTELLEIAWCCERLILEMARSKYDYVPASALAVCESYERWRTSHGADLSHDADTIMQYVAQLIKEL